MTWIAFDPFLVCFFVVVVLVFPRVVMYSYVVCTSFLCSCCSAITETMHKQPRPPFFNNSERDKIPWREHCAGKIFVRVLRMRRMSRIENDQVVLHYRLKCGSASLPKHREQPIAWQLTRGFASQRCRQRNRSPRIAAKEFLAMKIAVKH